MANVKGLPLWLILISILICSCNTKQENGTKDLGSGRYTSVPLQVTVIADLTDSLQPKTFLLEQMPKPITMAVPKTGGITKMFPVLRDKKGEPILDTDGKPFIIGAGGNSNFTNFTTDQGLPLDNISCSLMDKIGNLWFGTNGGGVSRYEGKSFITFTTASE